MRAPPGGQLWRRASFYFRWAGFQLFGRNEAGLAVFEADLAEPEFAPDHGEALALRELKIRAVRLGWAILEKLGRRGGDARP